MSDPMDTLHDELATYAAGLPGWAGQEGKFVLIAGKETKGIYDTYADALSAGYRELGLSPFLVKQIAAISIVGNFSRDLRPVCRISA